MINYGDGHSEKCKDYVFGWISGNEIRIMLHGADKAVTEVGATILKTLDKKALLSRTFNLYFEDLNSRRL